MMYVECNADTERFIKIRILTVYGYKSKYTKFDHPILAAEFIEENMDLLHLNDEEIEFIGDCIRTHMGSWTTDYDGNEILEKPHTKYQNFVHMCDYLASRKCIELHFDEQGNIIG